MKSNFIAAALSAAALLSCLHTGNDATVPANRTTVKKPRFSTVLNLAHTKQGSKNGTPAIQVHGHAFHWGEPGFVATEPIEFITMIP